MREVVVMSSWASALVVNKKCFAYDVKCISNTFWGTLMWNFFYREPLCFEN